MAVVFSEAQVRYLFQLSEGVRSRADRGAGHAGRCHVTITREDLWQRVSDYKGSGLAARTAFLSFKDQVRAATDLLNAPENAAPLEMFWRTAKPGSGDYTVLKHARTDPIDMRYGGGAGMFPCTHVRLVIDRDFERPHQIHIVTCFGEMGAMA